jgi:hypothetical protein
MTTLEKLFNIDITDVITIPLAVLVVSVITGDLAIGGVVGVIIGNRVYALLIRDKQ